MHAHIFICPIVCLLWLVHLIHLHLVIINMYDPITILWIVLGLFCVGLFLLLCFPPRKVPLAFVVKLVWWCWILLTFACLESFWFLHQIWIRVLLGRVFLVVGSSSFITLKCNSLLACRVSGEKSADSLMGVPLYVIFPLLLLIFYVFNFCQFDYYVLVCSSLDLYPAWDSPLPGLLFPSPC